MHITRTWRKALAVPVVLALAVGGALQTASSASAAEAGLTVTSPTEGQTLDSRTVTVEGSVDGYATVIVYAADGTTELARTNVNGDFGVPTPYTVELPAYADDATTAQTIEVGGLLGGSGIPQIERKFTLPSAEVALTVTSPTEGQTLTSRTVEFSGAGTDGSTVNVLDKNGDRIPGTTAAVVSGGTWSTTGVYTDDAAVAQKVYVHQVTGGAGRGDVERSFTLPAPLLPAPVITSPKNGEALTGATVTFTGTGDPSANVALLVVPTDLLNAPEAKAKAAPAKPTDPIVVDKDGKWSVTVALVPNDYTVVATEVTLDDASNLVAITSKPSTPVEFSLSAPAVVPVVTPTTTPTPAVTPTKHTSSKTALAETGLETTGFAGLSALFLLAGATLLILRRQRSTS
ncbi:hypothetical protein B7R21_03645 [Subtercola boreus]|uniref:Gram-positive cocci surface proteins LPxTG domain-containing protein n=1 Tax=Subtercola boreus TaxID=120213 RepID=A0A3E0W2L4_9MICO|nr:hypothetical protein [Subtercola boreus]RFA15808.1 hypothetical protein B7R21_03645 [Subtercola boreus]